MQIKARRSQGTGGKHLSTAGSAFYEDQKKKQWQNFWVVNMGREDDQVASVRRFQLALQLSAKDAVRARRVSAEYVSLADYSFLALLIASVVFYGVLLTNSKSIVIVTGLSFPLAVGPDSDGPMLTGVLTWSDSDEIHPAPDFLNTGGGPTAMDAPMTMDTITSTITFTSAPKATSVSTATTTSRCTEGLVYLFYRFMSTGTSPAPAPAPAPTPDPHRAPNPAPASAPAPAAVHRAPARFPARPFP